MLAVDTNVIVRFLVNDEPRQSQRAKALIAHEPVFAAITAILETEWVLRSVYKLSGPQVAHLLRGFAGLPNVSFEDAGTVAKALDLLEQGFDFADALHLEKSLRYDGFASFDRRFVKAAQRAGYTGARDV